MSHNATSLNFFYNQAIVGDHEDLTDSKKNNLIKQKKIINWNFVLECCILIVIPLPWYEHYWVMESINLESKDRQRIMYYLCDFIQVFMLLRLFFLARTIINYSVYTDAYSKKLCKSYGFTSGVRFALKVQCVMRPSYFVGSLFFTNIMVMSYILRVFEIPY